MKISLLPRASKQLKKLPYKEILKVNKKLQKLTHNPYLGKPLQGEYKGLYSLRAWPYRIIYQITNRQIYIRTILHRQNAYN
jgi:addiction module RelE/StbE family toxin